MKFLRPARVMEALETRDEKLQIDFLKKHVHSELYRQSDSDILIGSYLCNFCDHMPQLLKPALSLCSATREATALRNPHTMRSSPRTADRESPCNNEDSTPKINKITLKNSFFKISNYFHYFCLFPQLSPCMHTKSLQLCPTLCYPMESARLLCLCDPK